MGVIVLVLEMMEVGMTINVQIKFGQVIKLRLVVFLLSILLSILTWLFFMLQSFQKQLKVIRQW